MTFLCDNLDDFHFLPCGMVNQNSACNISKINMIYTFKKLTIFLLKLYEKIFFIQVTYYAFILIFNYKQKGNCARSSCQCGVSKTIYCTPSLCPLLLLSTLSPQPYFSWSNQSNWLDPFQNNHTSSQGRLTWMLHIHLIFTYSERFSGFSSTKIQFIKLTALPTPNQN